MTTKYAQLFLSSLLLLCCCQTPQSNPELISGQVIGIKDGDTYSILVDGTEQVVRLADIDCPEKSQPYGKAAKQFASDLCFGKEVQVATQGKEDRYGRVIGTVRLSDGVSVNEELVRAGFAWHYLKYSQDTSFAALERSARETEQGLWADTSATPPWEWRATKHP